MAISVFLSRPTPHQRRQVEFLARVKRHLCEREFLPRTIGETDYGLQPMEHIRSVITDCNGFIGLAFRRFLVVEGVDRALSDEVDTPPRHNLGSVENCWLTTPYIHLEAAAAYQIGLPVVLFVEKGVIEEGALEPGVLVTYPPTFDLADPDLEASFFCSRRWQQIINTWEGHVREVVHNKGQPPRLYNK